MGVRLVLVLATSFAFGAHSAKIRQKPSGALSCTAAAVAATADAFAAQFESHQFVFVSSTHGDAKIDEFLMCLISRPAFRRRVTDIVIEWASSGHQRLLDRDMLVLDEVPIDDRAKHPCLLAASSRI